MWKLFSYKAVLTLNVDIEANVGCELLLLKRVDSSVIEMVTKLPGSGGKGAIRLSRQIRL